MIRELRLANFKAFERFRLTLGENAFVVGPNNAGKSTILAAVRTGARMIRYASHVPPNISRRDNDRAVVGYRFTSEQFDFVDENIRHEGRGLEARMSLHFENGNVLTAVWPAEGTAEAFDSNEEWDEDDDEEDPEEGIAPFFFLERKDLPQPRRPVEVRKHFPSVGVVPSLSPLEPEESVLTAQYVRDNMEGRLSSRHFRNQLYLLSDSEFEAFRLYCEEWMPEITLGELDTRLGDKAQLIDLYYTEPDRHAEKEISWAGDGIQIWLQLLLHVFRVRDRETLVFDEPDLYLHPDLQRRLVRVLESLQAQTVTATHSSEVLAEAPSDSVIWIDKSRFKAVRGPQAATLAQLSAALGTQFNLRLAKALRSRAVLFVEGDDMKIVRSLARTLGARRLSTETFVAVIALEGFDNWEHLEPFSWLWDGLLHKSVPVFVVLDRDYRPASAAKDVMRRLTALGIRGHVWLRKELESYLLVPNAAARLSGADPEFVKSTLDSIASGMQHSVFARLLAEENKDAEARRRQVPTTERVAEEFEHHWKDPRWRLAHCPPKELLHKLNLALDVNGHKPLNARRLAAGMRVEEIDPEMADIIREVEAALG